MAMKYLILEETFEGILKRSNINDPNLVDALVNAVRETEDINRIIECLQKPIKIEPIKCNIYHIKLVGSKNGK